MLKKILKLIPDGLKGSQDIDEIIEKIPKLIPDELKDSQDADELKDSQDTDELKDSQDTGKNGEPPFPKDIWEYLENFHKKDMLNLPTQNDRIELLNRKPERVKVWDYFFPLNKLYIEDIDKLKQKKQDRINNYENNREKKLEEIEELRIKIQKEKAKLREVIKPNNECEIEIQNKRKYIQEMQKELKLNRDYYGLLTSEEEIDKEEIDIEFLHNAASAELDRRIKQLKLETLDKIHKTAWEEAKTKTEILYQLAKQEIKKRISELSDKIGNEKKIINHYEKIQTDIQKMKSSYDKDIAKIDEQVKSIEQLKPQVPCPPSDDEINQLLKYDLEKLKEECLRISSVGNRLAEISVFNEEGEEKRVDNPIIFISPGELQEISKIPLSYKPPLLTLIEQASEAFKSKIFSHLDKVPDALKPISKPDLVKHFLARRHTNAKQHNELYFGVYYMEYLMILDDMIILYSFFYDFIKDQKIGDRITEIYYEDIVAIEQCREDRVIPLCYDDKNTIEIPNVPMFRLILQSGNSHSVSFANSSYFINLFESFAKKDDSLTKMIYEQTIMANTALADAAINVLRKYLREHKGLVNRS